MRLVTWGALAVLFGLWAYRQIGFIRIQKPDVEQRKDIFTSTGIRYRRTQEANRWQLRLRNPRLVQRRKSA